MSDTDPDLPPHMAGAPPMQAGIPRPIEVSPVHFRAHGRCYAALVVDVNAEDPLSPDFTLDLVIFAPRDKQRKKDRFTNAGSLPGTTRWANNLHHALPDDTDPEKKWPDMTWHYPGRQCLPEVVLDGASS